MNAFWDALMQHWMTFPVVIPLLGAFLTPMFGQERNGAGRTFSAGVLFATAAAGVYAIVQASGVDTSFVYQVSGWSAPFGIVLVVDPGTELEQQEELTGGSKDFPPDRGVEPLGR